MTCDQRIKDAIRLLSPSSGGVASCKKAIDGAIKSIEAQRKIIDFERSALSAEGRNLILKAKLALKQLPDPVKSEEPVERTIKLMEKLAREPMRPGHRVAELERLAVRHAAMLLVMYGHPLSSTRGGEWEELAGSLLGEKKTFTRHMKAVRSSGAIRTLAAAQKSAVGRKPA